ncbi:MULTISPECIES: non-ribosomal peptide synthetase [unclassified Streptomyces]|uniref:non-ribosomal peptide synthetase n=1 Tax=unclassified Streptomyces TaxID=2593676 RepID=UPI000DB94DB4|nr:MULTISPECIES: non-ribosomal peptide synthetase [unclassified Streptomyces]MYT68261.1 amino acid adenylation domain-containing protein [Streptomyces sp. SID8367]RAJ76892.1 non-ribosomal peptide synthase protein (TIGR01720 family)/amino acid adenylation domain-containing protein [Streptomyces sp. PsTaAH-137]
MATHSGEAAGAVEPVAAMNKELSAEKGELLRRRLLGGARSATPAANAAPAVPRRGGTGSAALAPVQHNLWVADRLLSDNSTFSVHRVLRLTGPLDRDAVRRALDALVARHETLRMVFRDDSPPRQEPTAAGPAPLRTVDLSHLPPVARPAAAVRVAEEEIKRPFDLERGPVFRAVLAVCDDSTHVLVLNLHHCVADEWSCGVLAREFGALYAAAARGADDLAAELPPLAVSYADYADWQSRRLGGELLDRQLAYWRSALDGVPPVLELPADHVRPPAPSFWGHQARRLLSPELSAALRDFARRHHVTLYTALLALFAGYLHRWSGGQDRFSVLTPVSGRVAAETEPLIGMFANTLPLPVDVSDDPAFGALVRRLNTVVLGALEHQDVTFEQLVADSGQPRDASRNPLSQVMYQCIEAREHVWVLPGVRVEREPVSTASAKVDLSLIGANLEEGVRLDLVGESTLFEPETVERMLDALVEVVTRAVADPGTTVGGVGLLSAADSARVVDAALGSGTSVPDGTVLDLFAAAVAAMPDAPAVVAEGARLTYRELDELSDRAAARIRAAVPGPGALVGIHLPRSERLVATLLGVWKASCAYLPLPLDHPRERLRAMAEDAGVALVVAEPGRDAPFTGIPVLHIGIGDGEDRGDGGSAEAAWSAPGAGDLAYLMFTSGSTGRPKAVAIEHRGLVNFLGGTAQRLDAGPADVWLGLTGIGFDISLVEMFLPLVTGGRVVLAPEGAAQDGAAAVATAREHGVTHVQATPSGWRVLLAAGARLPRLALALTGGETLPPALAAELRQVSARVVNCYGPTECTVWATYDDVTDPAGDITVGTGLDRVAVHVLDAALRPVPVGVPGELYIGGPGVGRGYHGRPELTATTFVPDPFGAPGARLYRTGDLAARRPDGRIRFLGRNDHQVKIRGHRIELGEIEARLAAHPAVAHAVVVVDRPREGARLVAYVVGDAPEEALRRHLVAALPAAMVPAVFVRMENLPLTANGKVDRRRLPEPRGAASAERTPPAEGAEKVLAGVWSELLGVAEVAAQDNFFTLGGDSVTAVFLVSRAREAGYAFTARQVFAHQTLAELAAVAEPSGEGPARGGADPADFPLAGLDREGLDRVLAGLSAEEVADVQDIYPCTPLQTGMLFHSLHDDGAASYFNQYRWEIDGDLDQEGLIAAWRHVLDRHDGLRCSFRWDGLERPLQVVHRTARPDFTVLDWTDTPADDLPGRVEELLAAERAAGFDLFRVPPHRFHLVRTAPGRHLLIWHSHHILADGWSVGPLLNEVFATLTARRGPSRSAPALAAPVSHRAYVEWLAGQDPRAAERYWRDAFAGFTEPTSLPVVRQVPQGAPAGAARSVELALDPAVAGGLARLARERGCTVGTVFQAAWALLLGRWSRSRDVVFGLTVSGRSVDLPRVEQIVGLLSNTLPVRVRWEDGARLDAWLDRLAGQFAGLRDVEHTSLVDIHDWSEVAGDRRLFDSILVLQNLAVAERADLGGLAVRMGPVHQSSGYPLMLNIRFSATDAVLQLLHDDSRVEAGDAQRLLASFGRLLGAFLERPDARVGDLDILPDAERETVVRRWNDTARVFPAATTVPAMIEAQRSRTPHAPAVVYGGEEWTYTRLDAEAAGLALRLRAAGVRPGDRVALRLDRSAVMIAAVLAVWRVGGAYVPLDPEYPNARTAYVLEDSGARVLLASAEPVPACVPPGVDVVRVGDRPAELPETAGAPSVAPCAPHDVAYVLYTSGSTGRPKGVEVTHGSLAHLTAAMTHVLRVDGPRTWLGLTALSFDISTVEMFVPLTTGGRIVVVPEEGRWDAAAQRDLIRAHRVTHVQATPSGWRLLLAAGFGAADGVAVGLAGGEALPPALAGELRAALPRLVNVYGPTEATVWSTWDEIGPEPAEVTIGLPLPNTTAHVLDEALRPVPAGVPGELYLGGAGVARGYLGRPALTARQFLPDPFGGPGDRLYRTGDLAARGADGRIRFLGRDDHQVKVRGHRIELGEIEEALTRHPQVRLAAVTVHRDAAGEAFLVGHVVGDAPDPAAVRAFLRGEVSRAMVPDRLVVLERMPLNPAGKVDRTALSVPEAPAADPAARTAPRTPAERALVGIWARVLGTADIGVEDDFFALGGNSLKAVTVSALAREAGLAVATRQIFAHPTVAALARLGAAAREPAPAPSGPAGFTELDDDVLDGLLDTLGRDTVEDVLPLSPLQTGLFLDTLAETGDYVRAFAVDVEGDFDAAAFEEAWARLVERHAILRSTFHWAHLPHPVQVVRRAAPPRFRHADVTGLADGPRAARIAALVAKEEETVFDLSAAPPARFLLIRTAADRVRFVWTTHHVVFDGWSLHALLREAFALYRERRATGVLPVLADPPPYREFLRTLAALGTPDEVRREEEHWRSRLAGFTRPTALPGTRRTGAGDGVWLSRQTLPAALHDALVRAGRRHRVTVGTLVHTAWSLLLSRTSGERDVVFGTTVSGRFGDVEGIERMVGLLMNTLPLRVEIDPGAPLTGLLRDVQQRVTEVAGRAHVALPTVRRASRVAPGRRLFDSLLVYTDTGADGLPEGVVPVAEGEARDTGYPLVLEATGGDRLTLALSCEKSHYDRATADRLLAQVVRLLEGLAEDHASAGEVPMLSAEERELVVRGWNDTTVAFPADRTLHSLVGDRCAATPDAVAVRLGDHSWTYAELDARAERVAGRLHREGVRPGDLVALCTERSFEHVVGLLGILRAGAAFVPVDPDHPARRQAYMLADSGARTVLTQSRLRTALPEAAGVRVLALDDPDAFPEATGPAARADALPADLCSLYYTSGSTGAPKAVASHHAGWVNRMAWMQRRHGLRPGEGVLHKTTLSFDDAAVEILWPLINGGEVVLLPPGAHRDAHAMIEAVAAHAVVHVQFVPSVLEVFLDILTPERVRSMSGLRSVLTSGEALRPALVRRFRDCFGERVSLDNTWGATEVSIDSTCRVCTAEDAVADTGAVALGLPLDNNTVHVLDGAMNPLPTGATGELFIGGPGLARGYHGRPALTAERFVPDPFGPPGARLYRTGDLGRRRADGVLEFAGRVDHQVKLGGVRVELGEVEDALRRAPGVRDAVADVRTVAGARALVGYTTGSGDPDRTLAALRAELPDVMVPRFLVTVDSVPLNANGKVERAALPDPDPALREVAAESQVAPGTPTEEILAEVWCRVLGLPRVGVHDNFRALGGDSILLIHTVAKAREAGLSLTPRMVFEHPTVAALAAACDAAAAAGGATAVHAEQGPVTGEVPLGPIQHQYAALGPRDRFNQSRLLAVDPAVGADTLRTALRDLTHHHDALRLRWDDDGEGVRQYLAPADDDGDPLTVVDTPEEAEAAVEAAHAGLHLADGPLLRAVLFRHTGELLLVVHHVAVDTVSWHILVEDLTALCGGGRLPAKTTSVRHWAQRLHAYAHSAEFAAEAAYWTLPRPVPAALPADRPGGAGTEGRVGVAKAVLPAGPTAALLRQAAARRGAEPEHLMLAALARTLAEATGGDTVAIDVERHGREPLFDDVDLTRTVGWFTSVQPLLLTRPGTDDPDAWVDLVAEHTRTPAGRGIGHGLVRSLRGDERAAAPAQLSFNYHGSGGTAVPGDAPLRPLARTLGTPVDPTQRRSHPVEVEAAVLDGALHLEWRYARDAFDHATVQNLADRHLRHLAGLGDIPPEAVREPAEPFVRRLFAGSPAPRLPMLRHRVPGVGIAVIADGELRGAWGFGTLAADDPARVDERTVFQVGSISKHVTALGVLALVQEGRLDLDTDVNRLLTGWRLPGDGVTLRHLLTHTAGLGAQSYDGYRAGLPMPTAAQILAGAPPALTPPVRPVGPPGSPYLYSSSNYTVVQQVLQDVTGREFAPLMRELVLDPLGMRDSDFAPRVPALPGTTLARNHDAKGVPYPEGWHLYPESAAGGLWSTPRDLARVALEVQRAAHGGDAVVLNADSAAELLRTHPGTPGGLGTAGKAYGGRRWFGHTGGVPGFRALTWADPDRGLGLVVTANSDAGEDFLRELLHDLGVGLEDARW